MDRLVSRDTEQLSDAKTTVARHHGAGARITDPDLLHRYLDVRDVDKIEIEDDPDLAFIDHLSERYAHASVREPPPGRSAHRHLYRTDGILRDGGVAES